MWSGNAAVRSADRSEAPFYVHFDDDDRERWRRARVPWADRTRTVGQGADPP